MLRTHLRRDASLNAELTSLNTELDALEKLQRDSLNAHMEDLERLQRDIEDLSRRVYRPPRRQFQGMLALFLLFIFWKTWSLASEVQERALAVRMHLQVAHRLELKGIDVTPRTFEVKKTGSGLTICTPGSVGTQDMTAEVVDLGIFDACPVSEDLASDNHVARLRRGEEGCFALADEASVVSFVACVAEGM